jgi:D-alanyl-D-alanine carboxypeptidase (penicillin-binding protein 5/6)
MMNNKAKELDMKNTHFENVTGLDDDVSNHLTSAKDIAIMSKELLKYDKVSNYATIWMDSIRNGDFGLTNTNRLIRFYKGITGLKTGYTSKAGYCVSASAKREGIHLIAVIMGAESSTIRNNAATKLLDYGFSNYSIYSDKSKDTKKIYVYGGEKDKINIRYEDLETLINKGTENNITKEILLEEHIKAPVRENEVIGKIVYKSNGEIIAQSKIIACETVEKLSFWGYIIKIIKNLF